MFRLNHFASKSSVFVLAVLVASNGASGAFGEDPRPRRAPRKAPRSEPNPPKPVKSRFPRRLDDSWPERPEWVDMLADIMEGSQLGPNDGWFRRAVAQKRYTWEAFASRFDKDHDGKVSRKEFSGQDPDFARLDRDRDGAATARDFDFSAHALAPSPGAMLFIAQTETATEN